MVVLTEPEYSPWLNLKSNEAMSYLNLAPDGYLMSESAPKKIISIITQTIKINKI